MGGRGSERRPSFFSTSAPPLPFLPSLSAAAAPSGSPTPQRLPLLASAELRTACRRDIWLDPASTCADVDESTHCTRSVFAFPVACVRLPPWKKKKKNPLEDLLSLSSAISFVSASPASLSEMLLQLFIAFSPRGQEVKERPPTSPPHSPCLYKY